MRAFLGEVDRVTLAVLLVGLLAGGVWLVAYPAGLTLIGLAAPLGVFLLVMNRRWLESGLWLIGLGLPPAIAYLVGGPPPAVEEQAGPMGVPLDVVATGAALMFVVIGTVVVAMVAILGVRDGRRRERVEAEHARRNEERLGDADAP